LWINVLAWALRELVEMSKRQGGAMSAKLPELHPHTLRFTTKVLQPATHRTTLHHTATSA